MGVIAYKGFNKNMTCREFQFEEGKTYIEPSAKLCEKGFHACLNPINCFRYYPPAHSVFHEVEFDELTNEMSDDTKVCGKKIKIGKRLNTVEMIEKGLKYVTSKCTYNFTGGDYSVNAGKNNSACSGGDCSVNAGLDNSACSGGDCSVNAGKNNSACSGGDCSVNAGLDNSACSGGDYSVNAGKDNSACSGGKGSVNAGKNNSACSGGDYSVNAGKDNSACSGGKGSVNAGKDNSACSGGKGSVNAGKDNSACSGGDYSVNAGRGSCASKDNGVCVSRGKGEKIKVKGGIGSILVLAEENINHNVKSWCAAVVDDVKIKADTWYTIKDGEFVEVPDDSIS